jgi:hypothetical protein
MRRECREFQFLLVMIILGCGGILGGLFLWILHGCSCTHSLPEKVDLEGCFEGQGLEGVDDHGSCNGSLVKAAVDGGDAGTPGGDERGEGAGNGEGWIENMVLDMDLYDGVEDGEEGVIAQLVIAYLIDTQL